MKAVTIWQPYAGAVAAGLKSYETRSWPTRYRGPIAIHASVRPVKGDARRLAETYGLKAERFGEIAAYADLTDCLLMTPDLIAAQSRQELDFGDWRPGRYAWRLENIRLPGYPIKVVGRQGLWNFNEPPQPEIAL